MKYPIDTELFAENELEIEISGLFSRPKVLFDNQAVYRKYSNKNTFSFNDKKHEKHEVALSLPWLDPVIHVNLDGKTLNLNTQHSSKARFATYIPLAVMIVALMLGTVWPWLTVIILLPLALLAVRAMRLNHFSKKRKLILLSAILIPLLVLAMATWTGIQQKWENRVLEDVISRHVFYDVVLSADQYALMSRQGVVDMLEAFRTTDTFKSVELELTALQVTPELEVSISQSFYPKLNRDVWLVRFDFTTAELGVKESQYFANKVGAKFEEFLAAIENHSQ